MFIPVTTACFNTSARIFLEGAQELLGREHFKNVMDSIAPFEAAPPAVEKPEWVDLLSLTQKLGPGFHPGAFIHTLEERYGTQGGRGLSLRIGRVVFQKLLKQFGQPFCLFSVGFRLLPGPARLEKGLHILAQILAEYDAGQYQVISHETDWEWRVQNSSLCCGSAPGPSCYLMVGILQEFMSWAGGGRFYLVVESDCRSAGEAACVFRIDKKPLD